MMKGKELRAIRKRLGWTQTTMAKALRMAPNSIARWERDERTITAPMALLIRKIATENRKAKR